MRIGQTSIVVFASSVLAAALGFVGTVFFARTLGPEVIGIYATIVALVTWLQLGGKVGVPSALRKRLSEGEQRGAYLSAGTLVIGVASMVTIIALRIFDTALESYIGEFSQYTDISIVWFLSLLFALQVTYHTINAVLQGEHLVHVTGLLKPLRRGVITGAQMILVFGVGFGLLGLVVGHVVGLAVIALIGLWFVAIRFRWPARRHFVEIYEYAKYSWFGEVSSRTFSNADIIILSAFVAPDLVGIYSVAWALSSVLNLFGGAISSTVFPEISSVSARESAESAVGMIEDSVAFGGFLVIPGFVGGVLLAPDLFRFYGIGFGRGADVLWLLLLSTLAYSYLSQFTTALGALDRPDLVFRVHVVFVLGNVALNLLLIPMIGWVGAGVASAVSTALGTGISYLLLTRRVPIDLPLGEIGRQILAALVMGFVILSLYPFVRTITPDGSTLIVTIGLVGFGAVIYLGVLLLISAEFRSIILRNVPIELSER